MLINVGILANGLTWSVQDCSLLIKQDQSKVIENLNNILNMSLNKKPACELCLNWTMHSNLDNLRSLATKNKTHTHTFSYIYPHIKQNKEASLQNQFDNTTQH
jgi:hypothetical protein